MPDTFLMVSEATVQPSHTPANVSVVLHLDPAGRPVGSVRLGDGPLTPFVGWLALMAECARLLGPRPDTSEEP